MTVTYLTLSDLDDVEITPATKALANLAQLHQLPPAAAVYESTRNGYVALTIALTPATAEAWRAAIGAPPYTPVDHPAQEKHRTHALWFGAHVQLSYLI